MKKYFYLVYYRYAYDGKNSTFDLGVFSTKGNAQKKIEMSKKLSGFKKYGNLFKIIKFAVNFDDDIKKNNINLYYVWYELDDYYEIFDYFPSYEKAFERIEFYRKHTRIGKKYASLFQISDVVVDDYNSWSEGFD